MHRRVQVPFNCDKNKLFEVEIVHRGEKIWFDSSVFTVCKKSEKEYEYTLKRDDWVVTLYFCTNPCDKEKISSFRAVISGTAILRSVRYPYIVCRDVSPIDNLLFSSAWGDNIERPTKTIRDVSTSTSIRFAQDYIRYAPNEVIYTYPSIMAMQYIVLHNPSESFYLATYATTGFTETFHAKVIGKYDMELSVCHYPFAENEAWESPECATAFLGGGWHEAACLYRSHMQKAFPAPVSPEWVREGFDGWAEFIMKHWGRPLACRFSELPMVYKKMSEQTGIKCMFVVGWHDEGHDTCFPKYETHSPAGTREEFFSAAKAIHEMGGKILIYTNARLVDISGDFYKEIGHSGVAIDESGREYHESYETDYIYAVACPGSNEYSQQMASVAARIAGTFGMDGMFLDQISCNYDPFCFSEEHGHSKPSNNFLPGGERLLCRVKAAALSENPEFMTFAEGCHEHFGGLYDVNQGHGEEYTWQIGKSIPEQFLYTFPDRIVTGHTADKQQMYHSMAQMKPLDIKPSCYKDSTNHEPLRRYMALRRSNAEFFVKGIFIDDEGFNYESGLRLFAKRAGKAICVCLWRPGSVESSQNTGAFRPPADYKECRAIYPEIVDIMKSGDWVEASWTGPQAYFILC